MKKEMIVAVTGAIAGAVVGAITTALLAMIQVVSPLKEDLEVTLSEKNVLEKKLEHYMYGETIKTATKDNFSFEVASVKQSNSNTLIVKLLVSNLTDKTRRYFYVLKERTSAQTETLDVYKVEQLSVLATGMLDKKVVGMSIPPRAKHVPILLEFSNINLDSVFLTAINLSFSTQAYGRDDQLIVFNDLPIKTRGN